MQPNTCAPAGPARRWPVVAGTALVGFHLTAVLFAAVAAPSGPWPSAEGTTMAAAPPFAVALHRDLFAPYLRAVRLGGNYRFMSNRPGQASVVLQARLRDDRGEELAVLEFPDRRANPWVRHRQAVLVGWLASDLPVVPQGEVIPGPGQPVPTVPIWEPGEVGRLRLATVPQHLVPRDRPVFRPAEPSLVLIRSYARHLCRRHGASSVEMSRRSRDAIPATILTAGAAVEGPITVISTYGEFPR
jgi:hypothetical protein